MEKYKLLLFKGRFIKLFKLLWNDYFKKLKIGTFCKDAYDSITMYFKRKKVMKKYLQSCDSHYIISTRDFLNTLLGRYGRTTAIKIGWEHNHHHGNSKYADKIVQSVKDLDAFVLVSNDLYAFYKEKLKTYKCRCYYIPNVLEDIPKQVSKLEEKRIASVGRLSREKGFMDLLKLYDLLVKDYPDWVLDIIGDGVLKNNLEEYIKTHNLASKITLHGFQDKEYIDKVLNKSSLYVMTSYTESFGIVLLEAMSHGIPCLAYDSAEGACEIIQDGENGYLVKNRDCQEMIKKIKMLIENKEQRKKLGIEARKRVKSYTSDVVGAKWYNLLEESDNYE